MADVSFGGHAPLAISNSGIMSGQANPHPLRTTTRSGSTAEFPSSIALSFSQSLTSLISNLTTCPQAPQSMAAYSASPKAGLLRLEARFSQRAENWQPIFAAITSGHFLLR